MKKQTKEKLAEAKQYCDDNEKSTEFMIQYMQDFAGVDHDAVMAYLASEADKVVKPWVDFSYSKANTVMGEKPSGLSPVFGGYAAALLMRKAMFAHQDGRIPLLAVHGWGGRSPYTMLMLNVSGSSAVSHGGRMRFQWTFSDRTSGTPHAIFDRMVMWPLEKPGKVGQFDVMPMMVLQVIDGGDWQWTARETSDIRIMEDQAMESELVLGSAMDVSYLPKVNGCYVISTGRWPRTHMDASGKYVPDKDYYLDPYDPRYACYDRHWDVISGKKFCDAITEKWVHSVWRHEPSLQILAVMDEATAKLFSEDKQYKRL
jgi:hypothetical protein